MRRDLRADQLEHVRGRCVPHLRDTQRHACAEQRPGQPEVLRIRGDDLVSRSEPEARHDDVDALRRRLGERNVVGGDADLCGEQLAHALTPFEHRFEVGAPSATVAALPRAQLCHRVERLPGERPEGAGVQVRKPIEHREPLAPAHDTSTSTGA